jgi:large subunit ribosomal protein L30
MVKVRVTQVRSQINRPAYQRATLKCLGLGKVNSSKEIVLNPALLGMIRSVSHLVRVEEIN